MSDNKDFHSGESGARRSSQRLSDDHPQGDPFIAAIRGTRMAMIVTDPNLVDNPIIFANRAFAELTGYSLDEVIGRNCRFLQGAETNSDDVQRLRQGVRTHENTYVEILNYKKDGTPFWNALFVSPVENAQGDAVYFFGSQLDMTEKKENEGRLKLANAELTRIKGLLEAKVDERTQDLVDTVESKTKLLHELDHRVKNNLQLMLSLINLENRRRAEPEAKAALDAVRQWLQALATVHRKLYNADEVGQFDTAEFVSDLAQDLSFKSGRTDVVLELDTETVLVPATKAAPIALVLNDVITNALRFAYQSRKGRLRISLKPTDGRFVFQISDDRFTANEKEAVREAIGGTIVHVLTRQLEAVVDWCNGDPATLVRISLAIDGRDARALR